MDYFKTKEWADKQHEKWLDSFGEEPRPESGEGHIVGDDDDTPDIEDD